MPWPTPPSSVRSSTSDDLDAALGEAEGEGAAGDAAADDEDAEGGDSGRQDMGDSFGAWDGVGHAGWAVANCEARAPVIQPTTCSVSVSAIGDVGDLLAAVEHDDPVGDLARRAGGCG